MKEVKSSSGHFGIWYTNAARYGAACDWMTSNYYQSEPQITLTRNTGAISFSPEYVTCERCRLIIIERALINGAEGTD